MNGHITTHWRNAYIDGELEGHQLKKVEQHLAICEQCRAEVEELRSLREILQRFDMPETIKSPQRFVDEVRLQLPARPARPVIRTQPGKAWWMISGSLLGVLLFVQGVWVISTLVIFALQSGLGPQVGLSQWSLPAIAEVGQVLAALLSGQAASIPVEQLLEVWQVLHWLLVLPLELSGATALLYCSWLAGWRVYRRWSPDVGNASGAQRTGS